MKNKTYLLITCMALGALSFKSLAEETVADPSTGIKVVLQSGISTNWDYHTNVNVAYYGDSTGKLISMVFTNNYADAYVGTITSNKTCTVYYHGTEQNKTVVENKVIGEIWITSETITSYKTNYIKK